LKIIIIAISIFLVTITTYAEDITLGIEGWNEVQKGNYKKAIKLFQKCIETGNLTNSSLARTYRNMGIASRSDKQYKQAVIFYTKALELKPFDSWCDYVNRGNAWSDLGEYKKALLDYDKSLIAKPHYNQAYYNRGIVFEKQNKIKKAIIEFKLAYKNGLRSQELQSKYTQYNLMKEIKAPTPLQIPESNSLPIAKTIRSVWNLFSQPCNGGGGNSMQRHPKEAKIQTSKILNLDSLGFKIVIPQLPNIKNTHIKLYLGDKSRGVIDNYFLISEDDLSVPIAAIVITELPKHLQTIDKALSVVKTLQSQQAFKANIEINLQPIISQYGNGLELIVENRIGSHCFPTADFQLLSNKNKIQTIGISRFIMINKKLVEFALIVKIPKGISRENSIKMARKLMNRYWLCLKNI
jgi:hypothetical protein